LNICRGRLAFSPGRWRRESLPSERDSWQDYSISRSSQSNALDSNYHMGAILRYMTRAAYVTMAAIFGISTIMMFDASAAQLVRLSCTLKSGSPKVLSSNLDSICVALAKHLKSDLGISVTLDGDKGHRLHLEINPKSNHAIEFHVQTSPLEGGAVTTVSSILVSNDGNISNFSLRTLIRPIAMQLGLLK
jgi:hypothetical protein